MCRRVKNWIDRGVIAVQRRAARNVLKAELNQYYRAKRRREAIRERLMRLRADMLAAGGGSGYDAPRVQSSGKGSAAEILTERVAATEEKLRRQMIAEMEAMQAVIGMLELLPKGSLEREILEYRHLDCKSWVEIQQKISLSEPSCFRHYSRGLDILLGFTQIREKIGFESKNDSS